MENQIELNGEFDDLLDGVDATETNDDGAPDDSVELPDNLDVTVEDDHSDDVNDSNDDDNTEEDDAITSFLKSYGIADGKTLTFENENGESESVDFSTLSESEKFDVLKQLATPNLSDDEITTINYLRQNNATLQDVVEYYSQKAVQDYIAKQGAPEVKYSVDDYSNDELYTAELKAKYPEMSDEEIVADLETAKENEAVFNKKVEAIRKQYKAIEDQEAADAKQKEQELYENFKNSVAGSLQDFNEVGPNFEDDEAVSVVVEDSEKDAIFEYLTKQDANGYTQIYKDINDPNKLVKIAWFIKYGEDAISNLTKYYTKIIADSRKTSTKKVTKEPAQVVQRKDDKKKEDNFKYHGIKSFDLKGYDDLL